MGGTCVTDSRAVKERSEAVLRRKGKEGGRREKESAKKGEERGCKIMRDNSFV